MRGHQRLLAYRLQACAARFLKTVAEHIEPGSSDMAMQMTVAAYHEAGHAAWELLHNRPVKYMNVYGPARGQTGTNVTDFAHVLRTNSATLEEVRAHTPVQQLLNDYIPSLLAGLAAERLFDRESTCASSWSEATTPEMLSGSGDQADAAYVLHRLNGCAGRSNQCARCAADVRQKLEDVAERLHEHWNKVEALAAAVLARANSRAIAEDSITKAWEAG